MQKIVMSFLLLTLITSCADVTGGLEGEAGTEELKKDPQQIPEIDPKIEPVKVVLDRDFDLIPDEEDERPDIADIPEVLAVGLRESKLSFRVVVDPIGGEKDISIIKDNIEPDGTLAENIIAKAVRESMAQIDSDLSSLNDEETWAVQLYKFWDNLTYVQVKKDILENKDNDYVPYSGVYKLRYKLDLSRLENVDYIENIKVKASFRSKEEGDTEIFSHLIKDDALNNLKILTKGTDHIETLDMYTTISYENDPSLLRENIANQSVLSFGIQDFYFGRKGKKVNYLNFVQKIKSSLANVIVSDETGIKRYFIVPGRTFGAALKDLGFKIEANKRGMILKFNDRGTTVLAPDDIRNPSLDFLDGRIVKIFGNMDIDDNVIAGGTYVVSLLSGEKIFSSKTEQVEQISNFEFQNLMEIKNLRVGDILEFQLSGRRERMGTRVGVGSGNVTHYDTRCARDEDRDIGIGRGSRFMEKRRCWKVPKTGWCEFRTFYKNGYHPLRNLSLNKDHKNYSFIFSDGTRRPLASVATITPYSLNSKLLGIVRVTKEMISSSRKIIIKEESAKAHRVRLGFWNYLSCQAALVTLQNPEHSRQWMEQVEDQVKTVISVRRIGAAR